MNDLSPETVMRLADNMAAAAANFNAHGYDQFITAREELIVALKQPPRTHAPNQGHKATDI
jgi:hypothetical protein